MKELFRERDYTRVGYYQSVLESEGISTLVRNQDLVTMMTEVPIPDMFPALCVVHDEDHEPALKILKDLVATEEGPVEPESTKGVFVIGVGMIFGGYAAVMIAMIVEQLLYEDIIPYWQICMRGAIAMGACWIVWITVKRWIAEKRSLSKTKSEGLEAVDHTHDRS